MARFFTPQVEYKAPDLEDLIKPLEIYRQVYEQTEEKYDAQREKAAMLKAMLGNDPDNELANYMSDYNALMDETARGVATNNLPLSKLVNNYKRLQDMWYDKGLKATAAIDAYTKYKDALSKVPGAIAPDYKVMDFVRDPNSQYSIIDPKLVEAESANAFKQIGANMDPHITGSFLNGAYNLLQQGLTMEQILNTIQPDSPYAPIVENIRQIYGDQYNSLDKNSKAAYNAAIQRGAMAGLATTKAMEDPSLSRQLQSLQLQDARREQAVKSNYWWLTDDGQFMNGYGEVVSEIPQEGIEVDPSYASVYKGSTSNGSRGSTAQKAYTAADIFGKVEPSGNDMPDIQKPGKEFKVNGTKIKLNDVNCTTKIVKAFNDKGKLFNNNDDTNEVGQHICTTIAIKFENGMPVTNWEDSSIPKKIQDFVNAYPSYKNYHLVKTIEGEYAIIDFQ